MGVSIGVTLPYFNRQSYIAEAIDSVLSQKGVEVKIFAVNDGSEDGSEKVVQKFLRTKRVVNSTLGDNFGVAVARNLAAAQAIASGHEYIFNMGSDDILLPGALADMAEQLILTNSAFCTPQMVTFGDAATVYSPPANRRYMSQRYRNALVGATMYRASIWNEFGGYDVKTYTPFGKATWEDYDLTTRVLAKGHKYCVSSKVVYQYRKHPESASSDIRQREVKRLLREIYNKKFQSWS